MNIKKKEIFMTSNSVIYCDCLEQYDHHYECPEDWGIQANDDSDIDPRWERNETTRGFWIAGDKS